MSSARWSIVAAAVVAAAAAVAAALVLAADASDDVSVRVEPADGLLDEPFRLVVDARPGEMVRLTLSLTAPDGERWSASRSFTADDSGEIDVDGAPLLAAMRATGRRPDPASDRPRFGEETWRVELEAREGTRLLGRAIGSRSLLGPGVRRSVTATVARDGFAGHLWSGPVHERRPVAVVLLGGSEGGYPFEGITALLAARGYPALQLAYFRAEGLPPELRTIPLEYVARALEWVGRREGVDPAKVVVVGISRGAELALILGSRFPELVAGVASYAPCTSIETATDDVAPSWTLGGRPLAATAGASPRIRVERIRGPVLSVAGTSDSLCGAAYVSSAIVERRRRHGRADTEEVVVDDAGHGVGAVLPYLPGPTELTEGGLTYALGGSPEADALARTAAWRKLRALLETVERGSG